MDRIKKIVQGLAQNLGKLNKLSLPAVILIASIILGGFYYTGQVNKQRSIEKQQQIELEAKTEKENKDYEAKRKLDCLAIYKAESDKWNNVQDWHYSGTTTALGRLAGGREDVCLFRRLPCSYSRGAA